ncbi:MAG TPA: ABC transporter permease [Phycisphaerae bacterium]|nr:ABC transporter permease [Phycisphaerae bacterium]
MNLASRDVRHHFGRFALTCVGVSTLLMIVMGMGGIYRGLVFEATLLIDRLGADLWIVQEATRGPFAEISRIPMNMVDRVAAVPGIARAQEFVYTTIQRQREGRPLRMAILGLDWPYDKGEWLPLAAGRSLGQAHYEMVADRSLGLRLGERIRLGKDSYAVVGLTAGMTDPSGNGFAFFSVRDAQAVQFDLPGEAIRLERETRRIRTAASDVGATNPALLDRAGQPAAKIPVLTGNYMSAVVAWVKPGYRPDAIKAVVERWPDVSIFTRNQEEDLLLQGVVEKAKRQLGMFRVLLTIVSAVIMALILYTMTLDKLHDIAVLKLIGASNWVILGLILQQALLLGAIGYGLAYLLGQRLFPMFPRRVVLTSEDLWQLAFVVLGISVGASLLGVWKALRVSPNQALVG